jgi:hypothetical protein
LKENGEVAAAKWAHLTRRIEGTIPKTKATYNTFTVQLSNRAYITDLLGHTTIYYAHKSWQSWHGVFHTGLTIQLRTWSILRDCLCCCVTVLGRTIVFCTNFKVTNGIVFKVICWLRFYRKCTVFITNINATVNSKYFSCEAQ